ncbi:MAG: hypothetical protein K2L45_04490 [Muribaculaceae bacterium]|nr:hypothetical protein [Muribaculaceae bacterium]
MNPDKYYWTNRASIHHIERLKDFLPANSDAEVILRSGSPRYIEHWEESVVSGDGHRRYDLLLEYDIYHPSHGIYFGCRSLTLPGFDHDVETKEALEEWNKVMPLALRRLNNVFPEKDFSSRLRDTDNDNDRTFWPFWISLHEDESPHDVACVALRIMSAAYRDYIAGKSIPESVGEPEDIVYPHIRTAFTQEAYDSFLNRMAANVAIISDLEHKQTNMRHAIRIFESVLEKAEARGLVTRSDAYACAWCLKEGISDIEFASMVKAVFRLIGDNLNLPSPVKIPWKDLIRIFLRYDETPFKEQLKTLKAQQDTISLIERQSLKLMAE